ncbi:MAG: response regulator transcription factor [Bacteroidetes bacterium]|nr:response regulator transcription factor [Bacteroidota bacterium]
MKILIAEDDPVNLLLLKKQLALEQMELCAATDGYDAFKKMAAFQPDILITDLMMPLASGLELISLVRTKYSKKLPILVLSAIDDENTVMEALSMGANDFIIKPADQAALVSKINRLCGQN